MRFNSRPPQPTGRPIASPPPANHAVAPLVPSEVATTDPELAALIVVGGCLEPLEPDARRRVLRWVADRLDCAEPPPARRVPQSVGELIPQLPRKHDAP